MAPDEKPKMDIQLRAFVFLDKMQPQFASFLATVARGYLPVSGMASIFIETAPGMPINRLTDIALKSTNVRPSELIVERAFGMLEFHHDKQSEVLTAGKAVLDAIEMSEEDKYKPRIVTNEIIKNVDDYQAMLINRTSKGMMLLHGESLFIMETVPAAYITFAANEAEKAAEVSLINIRAAGAFGRLHMSGTEADMIAASEAATKAIEGLSGRTDWKR